MAWDLGRVTQFGLSPVGKQSGGGEQPLGGIIGIRAQSLRELETCRKLGTQRRKRAFNEASPTSSRGRAYLASETVDPDMLGKVPVRRPEGRSEQSLVNPVEVPSTP